MHPPSWEGGCQSFSEIMDEKMWTVMFSTHVMLRSFVSPAPEPMTLPEILVKSSSITPGWCRKQRRPECDLGKKGPSQGAGMEWNSGTSPQVLETECEHVPDPVQCQPHLCGQGLCGQEYCLCRLCTNLLPWWVQPSRGEGHPGVYVFWVRALGFSPHSIISTTFHQGHPIQELGEHSQFASAFKFLSHPCSPLYSCDCWSRQ